MSIQQESWKELAKQLRFRLLGNVERLAHQHTEDMENFAEACLCAIELEKLALNFDNAVERRFAQIANEEARTRGYAEAWKRLLALWAEQQKQPYYTEDMDERLHNAIDQLRTIYGDPNVPAPQGIIEVRSNK